MTRGVSALLIILCLILGGCVSSSRFEEFQAETHRDLSDIRSDIRAIEKAIQNLEAEIRATTQNQASLDARMREWLSISELKLKEMEDRVVELRLLLKRSADTEP